MSDATPTQRFSDRVANYVRYRPGYPAAVLQTLREQIGLSPPAKVADIGSGTGIASRMLLEAGCEVFAVEPNPPMRAAAEDALVGHPRFHSIAGTSEATTLPDHSVAFIVAAQAFHWFAPEPTRREFVRILQPQGWCVLLWNTRRLDSTPFLRDLETLLLTFGTDYQQVRHENVDPAAVGRFLGGPVQSFSHPNEQVFDWDGLAGRLLSSSYAPGPEHPQHAAMMAELRRIYDRHQDHGRVRFEYDTDVYYGQFADG